jgi:hypothetical protein
LSRKKSATPAAKKSFRAKVVEIRNKDYFGIAALTSRLIMKLLHH